MARKIPDNFWIGPDEVSIEMFGCQKELINII